MTAASERDELRHRIGEVLSLPWVQNLSDPRGHDVRRILTGDARSTRLAATECADPHCSSFPGVCRDPRHDPKPGREATSNCPYCGGVLGDPPPWGCDCRTATHDYDPQAGTTKGACAVCGEGVQQHDAGREATVEHACAPDHQHPRTECGRNYAHPPHSAITSCDGRLYVTAPARKTTPG